MLPPLGFILAGVSACLTYEQPSSSPKKKTFIISTPMMVMAIKILGTNPKPLFHISKRRRANPSQ